MLTLRDISVGFGGTPLLNGVALTVHPGERVGLVGRNGAGKTTLLKIIAGVIRPDGGAVERGELRVTYLEQEVPGEQPGTVFDVVARGLGEVGEAAIVANNGGIADGEVWQFIPTIEAAISRTELDPNAQFSTLSGGLKRRTFLARALAQSPDILLLDEPTNHLDIPAIEWLEGFLRAANLTVVVITHDRAFLQQVATRIVEIDRAKLLSWECDYRTYLERREKWLADEAATTARMDKRIAAEAKWAARGVSARRTKAVGRLQALERLRADRAERRAVQGTAKFSIHEAERSGKLVAQVEGLSYAWPGQDPVVDGLKTVVLRGDRLGIIGPNGCGKTTLIKLLLGDLEPDAGTVKIGTKLETVYFDQSRTQLDPELSVADTVAEKSDRVEVGGRNRHIIGYLQDFLFAPERARSPVGSLSGGEKNRLLLAKLFLRPANLLILDEPTNDLDAETLDLLEEKLHDFQGTVILVSHDRAFLDAVCTSVLAFEGGGSVNEYVGGYTDWLRQRNAAKAKATSSKSNKRRTAKRRKLGFNEKREYEGLPAKLESLEEKKAALEAALCDPAVYSDAARLVEINAEVAALEGELATGYARWEELELIASD